MLAVADVVDNELTAMATHALPVAAMFERSDVTRNKVHAAHAPALLPLPGDARLTWWVWAQLGQRLGIYVLGGLALDECDDDALNRQVLRDAREPADDFMRRGTHGDFNPRLWGWFHEHALPDGRWRIAPAPLVERLTHGANDPNVASLIAPEADPLTGQPVFTAFTVELAIRAAARGAEPTV